MRKAQATPLAFAMALAGLCFAVPSTAQVAAPPMLARPAALVTVNGNASATVSAWLPWGLHSAATDIGQALSKAKAQDDVLALELTDVATAQAMRPYIAQAILDHVDLLLTGDAEAVQAAKPEFLKIWANGSTFYVSTRSESEGLTILQMDEASASADGIGDLAQAMMQFRARNLGKQAMFESPVSQDAAVTASGWSARSNQKSWDFQVPSLFTDSPEEVCRGIRRAVDQTVPRDGLSPAERTAAIASACMYGTIADVTPQDLGHVLRVPLTPNDKTFAGSLVNLRTQWMMLVSTDPIDSQRSKAYLWVKTNGTGGGSGFGYAPGITPGYFYIYGGLNMLEPRIHSGWGSIGFSLGQTDPLAVLARCDNGNTSQSGCPHQPRLLSLTPDNSSNGRVSVGTDEGWNISGNISGNASGPSLSLTAGHQRGSRRAADLNLMHVSTDVARTAFKTTRWFADFDAITSYGKANGYYKKDRQFALGNATPLARSLNPEWSAVWEIPLELNRNRPLSYVMVYESSLTACILSCPDASSRQVWAGPSHQLNIRL